jgi:hypothetical protein
MDVDQSILLQCHLWLVTASFLAVVMTMPMDRGRINRLDDATMRASDGADLVARFHRIKSDLASRARAPFGDYLWVLYW